MNGLSAAAAPHGGDIYGSRELAQEVGSGRVIDFSVNLNPLGMPPGVIAALREQLGDFSRYPDPHCRLIRSALEAYEAFPQERIVCGNGAADLLFRLGHSVKPKRALIVVPGFSEYERAAKEAGAETAYHLLREEDDFALTPRILDDIKSGLDMLFVAHPNNPTGRLIEDNLLEAMFKRCVETGTLLVVDECFLPFTAASSSARLLTKDAPLVILKALTKTYSLAGFRLGYCLCGDSKIAEGLNDSGQFWSVSGPAQAAGIAALQSGGWLPESKKIIEEERPKLTAGLRALGLKVYPSDANFLLFRLDKALEPSLESRCFQRGVMLRPCGNFPGLDSRYYRSAVKTSKENQALLERLADALL